MNTKHTPGPWKVINGWDERGSGKYFPSVVFCEREGEFDEDDFMRYKRIIINESHDQTAESIMANARLIAAAPDLLRACEQVLATLEGKHERTEQDGNRIRTLRAAITKATSTSADL